MRIATWNVNSLKARLEKVLWWLDRAKPDVLLLQETKLADADARVDAFKQAGYELVRHGEGRWNGVAIASRCGIDGVVANFGEPLRPACRLRVCAERPAGRFAVLCSQAPVVRQTGTLD
jgi:exodeoxyribonuclease III